MRYQVHRLAEPFKLDGDWDKAVWRDVAALDIDKYVGHKPEHFPKAQAKLLYDEAFIYVIFRVEDRYVRAVASKHQDSVCRDSCVEFFFTPGDDIAQGYFNLEMNCGGTILLYHQTGRDENRSDIPVWACEQIEVRHSLPKIVEPEITEPVTWTVEYRVAFDLLEKFAPVARPAAGALWRANFYKCGDETSHPHWLSWAPIALPKPDFHRPEFFGELGFE